MEPRLVLAWMRRRIAWVAVCCLAAGLFLFGLIALGKWAHGQLRGSDRYSLAFTDIECDPPPGAGRVDFLAEVQYLAGLPDRLHILENGLRPRLRRAFSLHPWVREVESVEIEPPRQVRVRLRYRVPVLAVSVSGRFRAVDAQGILLPATAATAGLPRFEGQAPPPAGPAGVPWGDPAVEAAARRAAAAIK